MSDVDPTSRSSRSIQTAIETSFYHVPSTYMPGVAERKGLSAVLDVAISSKYSAFFLGVLLPDFQPAALNHFEYTRTGWHRQLRLLFEHPMHFLDDAENVRAILNNGKVSEDKFYLDHGCRVYRGPMIVTTELHVCYLPDRLLVFDCKSESSEYNNIIVPYPSCHISENLEDGSHITYDYSRAFKDDAISIDTHVRNLIKSFRQNARTP